MMFRPWFPVILVVAGTTLAFGFTIATVRRTTWQPRCGRRLTASCRSLERGGTGGSERAV